MAAARQDRADNIDLVPLKTALSERYLAYALSTITARSLPDVRDGLKPVQRRLLFAMRQLKLDPKSGFKKCARVVGDVMGKFHPHGDAAIYDALVRLAQEFAQRYPLIDGQGNFGNIDGDNAAAMRYTEARLTEVAEALLAGINEDAVDFRPTYDGNDDEPVVLPAAFPNLLANGSAGIAVGMATSIPPHNAGEVCTALLHLLDHAQAEQRGEASPDEAPDTAALLRHMPGPDFPTGGVLLRDDPGILQAYRSGRGQFRVRAAWHKEPLGQGQYQIVVTQLPYHLQKARLIERIADLLAEKKLSLLGDVRDESAEEVRLVLVPRSRTVEPGHLMEQMFKATDLESRFSLNLNVLDAQGVPRVMGLGEVLHGFLDHRMVVLERRSRHRLGKIEARIEVLEGLIIAFLNLDEVIRIIRSEDEPKPVLMTTFDLTDRQAEAILETRLRQLRKLEEMQLKKEAAALKKERKALNDLLRDRGLRLAKLAEEIAAIRTQFASGALGARRTVLETAPVIDLEAVALPVERNPVTVVCSEQGWLRVLKGHVSNPDEIKYKEGDGPRFLLPALNSDKLLLTATDGRCYLLPIDKLPGGRGQGEPISLHLDLAPGAQILAMQLYQPDGRVLFATAQGRGFIARHEAIAAQTRNGKQVVAIDPLDQLLCVRPLTGDHVAVIGNNRKLLLFPLDELPELARGKGVLLQRYGRDGRLQDATTLELAKGLTWRLSGGRVRREPDLSAWLGRRASAGKAAPRGFPLDNTFPALVEETAGEG